MISRIPPALARDKKLSKHIKRIGPIDSGLWKKPRNPFHSLIRSIVSQQVSGKAATSILKKFQGLYSDKMPTPKQVLATTIPRLRSAGLSENKAKYVLDLAKHFANGSIDPRTFKKMSNDQVTAQLTQVKGVGVWTAHMFLLFTLERPDVLPTLDLGVRKGFQIVYELGSLPTHQTMEAVAKRWREHASLASLYFWRVADGQKK